MNKLSLIGFDKTESYLSKLQSQGKLPHGLILCGQKGIGKASFALDFALKVIGSSNQNHPDLLLIKKEEGKRDISVDRIRKISAFLNQTSAISKNRFIIIDSADDLNRSSSNALLKTLEEPSDNCFLLLIAHSEAKLLPTIKSRCQIVKIDDFNFDEFKEALKIIRPKALPKLEDEEIKILSQICANSPAKANMSGDDLTFIYEKLLKSIEDRAVDGGLLKKISEKNFNFDNFEEVINFFSLKYSKFLSGLSENFILNEKEVFQELKNSINLAEFFEIDQEIKSMMQKVRSLNLDKKLVLINILNLICKS